MRQRPSSQAPAPTSHGTGVGRRDIANDWYDLSYFGTDELLSCIRGFSEAAKLWDGFEWAPNPLFTGEVPPDPSLRQHRQQGRGDCESDDDDDYYGVYGNDDLYGATLGSEGGLGRMLQAEHEWG